MMGAIGLVAMGFLGGVVLTGIAACYLYGLLHAEAVRALEDQGGFGSPYADAHRPLGERREFTPNVADSGRQLPIFAR